MLTRLWHNTFWSEPYLYYQAAFSTWTKGQDKNLNILRTKKAFTTKEKAIFIFLRFSLKQIKHKTFSEGESLTKENFNILKGFWDKITSAWEIYGNTNIYSKERSTKQKQTFSYAFIQL